MSDSFIDGLLKKAAVSTGRARTFARNNETRAARSHLATAKRLLALAADARLASAVAHFSDKQTTN